MHAVETARVGYEVLTDPFLNKGTAFTQEERDALELNGLLPPNIGTLDEQVSRRIAALRGLHSDLGRYTFLRELQDLNETLFYAVLTRNLEELLPIVYTPTVGLGCQEFSRIFRKPRGLYLSPPHKDRLPEILANRRFDDVVAIVATDGERILGLGDQGAGGMGISIGKLALYTGCGGLNPATTLPIMLDVGTDNERLLADPLYVGWRHERVRGAEYDAFVEAFVEAVAGRWPHVLLQFEDFAKANATRLLGLYRDRLCCFNDDIQGTAAVATGTLLSAVNVTGIPLEQQIVAILGAGSAGCGIATLLHRAMVENGLDPQAAARRFYLIDQHGLLVEGMNDIADFQRPFVQQADAVAGWTLEQPGRINLTDVCRNAGVTALIGVSGQPGAFSREAVTAMAEATPRPIIFPLSNPTSRSEAKPEDLMAWTHGRVVMGTGSPFPPVMRDANPFAVDQTNNSYIFPGVGLGAIAVKAKTISDGMFMAAARALAEASPARSDPNANLLPRVAQLRELSVTIAIAVGEQACRDNLCPARSCVEIEEAVREKIWTPLYHPVRRLTRRVSDA